MRVRIVQMVVLVAIGAAALAAFSPPVERADAAVRRPRPTTTTTTTTTTAVVPTTTRAATTTTAPAPTTVVTTTLAASTTSVAPTTTASRTAAVPCVVRLHGKGGDGTATTSAAGRLEVSPRGNSAAWGGWQWLYFPDAAYAAATAVVANAIDANGCTRVVIVGFSNGAAFTAKLACRNVTFGGTVVGYVIDDPVPDHGTDVCSRALPAVLYWTGALAGTAQPGWSCALGDWTCEGGTTIGIAATASHLSLAVTASPNTTHSPYVNPPEIAAWLR